MVLIDLKIKIFDLELDVEELEVEELLLMLDHHFDLKWPIFTPLGPENGFFNFTGS